MLFIILLAIFIIWLILYIIGKFIKYSFVYEQSTLIEVPPNMLWPIMINHRREKDWRNNILEVVKMPNIDGLPVWKEIHRNKKEEFLLQTVVSDGTKFILERKLIDHNKYGGTTRYEVNEDELGSKLTLKHHGEVYTSHAKLKHILLPGTKKVFVQQYLSDVKQRAIHVREERDDQLE